MMLLAPTCMGTCNGHVLSGPLRPACVHAPGRPCKPHLGSLRDHGSHADERVGAHSAAFQDCSMTDGDVVPNDHVGGVLAHGADVDIVLHVGVLANVHAAVVTCRCAPSESMLRAWSSACTMGLLLLGGLPSLTPHDGVVPDRCSLAERHLSTRKGV